MKFKNRAESGHCTACLTGEYPGGVPEELSWQSKINEAETCVDHTQFTNSKQFEFKHMNEGHELDIGAVFSLSIACMDFNDSSLPHGTLQIIICRIYEDFCTRCTYVILKSLHDILKWNRFFLFLFIFHLYHSKIL